MLVEVVDGTEMGLVERVGGGGGGEMGRAKRVGLEMVSEERAEKEWAAVEGRVVMEVEGREGKERVAREGRATGGN
jgi:hypothetical protein